MTSIEIITIKNCQISTPKKYKNKPRKKNKKTSRVQKPTPEFFWIINNCPNLVIQKLGSQTHLNSEKVIRGLKNGLISEFAPYIDSLFTKGSNQRLSLVEMTKVINKKFTLSERKAIYQKLNDLHNLEFWPINKKNLPKNLYAALSPDSKFGQVSWLLYVICKEIQPLKRTAIHIMDWEVGHIVDRWPSIEDRIQPLKKILNGLRRWYEEEFLLPYYEKESIIGGKWGTWNSFFLGYINFIEKRYSYITDVNPGWFKSSSKPISAWQLEMKAISRKIEKAGKLAYWAEIQMQEQYSIIAQEEIEQSQFECYTP